MSAPEPSRKTGDSVASRFGLFDKQAWAYFWKYYRSRRPQVFLYAIIASAQSVLVLPVLYLIRYSFDEAIPNGEILLLTYAGAGIVVTRLLHSGISLLSRNYILRIMKGAVFEMRQDLVAKLYGLSHEYFGRADADRIHARLVQDTERVDQMSDALMSRVVPSVITCVALIVVLLFINWWLVLLAAPVLMLVGFSTRLTGKYVKRRVYVFQRAFEAFSKGMLFVLRQMDLTRIQAFEEQETQRQNQQLDHLRGTSKRMAMGYAIHNQIQSNVVGIGGIIVLVAGGTAIANGTMTIGAFLAFYVAAGLLNGAASTAINGLPPIITGNESLVTLRTLMNEGPAEPYKGSRRGSFEGNVTVENVTFGYGDHQVLSGVNFNVARGDRVAIVGPNGAGKSTILSLILGLYRPTSGRLLADGIPYEELDIHALRRAIGVVMQRPTMFSGTVWENVTYGWPDIGRDKVIEATKGAFAQGLIEALPDGYDTQVGERGVLLSGGECQRLAIARALLGNPTLLILDEPTNHLDAEAIEQLMSGLLDHPSRPAILIISHDPNAVRFAETVYQLESGVLIPADAPPASPALLAT